MVSSKEFAQMADRIRLRAVKMVAPHGFGYLGQALSSAEWFAVLYGKYYRPNSDDLVVSPGHYIITAFAASPEVGSLDESVLSTYGHDGSQLEAIGTEKSPTMDLTCGSLAKGFPALWASPSPAGYSETTMEVSLPSLATVSCKRAVVGSDDVCRA